MKYITIIILVVLSISSIQSQVLDVEGNIKVSDIPISESDSVLTLLPDGQIGIRTLESVLSKNLYLGKDTLDGIVFNLHLGSDGEVHGLIVAKDEYIAQWQEVASTTNATSTWDGKSNTGLITNSPAIDSITANFSSEWYLPSLDELVLLWDNRFYVNKAMNEGGFIEMGSTSSYWSSTEYDEDHPWFLFYGGYGKFDVPKTNTNIVRPIRSF